MKIALVSIGTRGDIEPFVALGELLKANGHEVLCAFPEQFATLATQAGLEFESLGKKFIELLESEDGKAAMGGASGWKKFMGTLRLAMNQSAANREIVFKQEKVISKFNPDRILYSAKALYPHLWHLKTGRKIVFISPLPYMHYVKGHTHMAFNSNFGEFFNKLTFALTEFGMIVTIRNNAKWLKINDKLKGSEIREILREGSSIYTISPSLFKRPAYWPESLHVLGHHQKKLNQGQRLPAELQSFIDRHDKILMITFGSMSNSQPAKKTQIILDILLRNKIPAIINTAAGGLVKPPGFDNPNIFFTKQLPYELVFPQIYGAIHHGGSGTTHLALKYGCASMIIPHIMDQFVWNKILAERGVGPLGVSISKVSTSSLEPKILALHRNPQFKERAEAIQTQMAQEDFKEDLLTEITQ